MKRTVNWKGAPALLAGALWLAAAGPAFAADQPDFIAVLKTIDQRSNFEDRDFSAVVSMVNVDPEKGTEVKKVNVFRRDKQDKFLLLTQEPVTQKGQGTLRVDDNLWVYDPISRKFTHSTLKENFENTAAKHSDFRKSTRAEDYRVESYAEGVLGRYKVWIVDLKAVNDEVTYPFMKMWVGRDEQLALKTEEYSLTKRLLRSSYYPSYTRVGQKYIATQIIFVDALIPGKKTQVNFGDISLDKLPDDVFTKSYLERVNR